MNKLISKWKTLVLSLIVAIVGVLETTDWTSLLGETTGGVVVTVVGILMAVVAWFTKTELDTDKEDSK